MKKIDQKGKFIVDLNKVKFFERKFKSGGQTIIHQLVPFGGTNATMRAGSDNNMDVVGVVDIPKNSFAYYTVVEFNERAHPTYGALAEWSKTVEAFVETLKSE